MSGSSCCSSPVDGEPLRRADRRAVVLILSRPRPYPPSMTQSKALLIMTLAAGLLLGLAACNSPEAPPAANSPEAEVSSPAPIPSEGLVTPEPRRYASVEAIAGALADVGLPCEQFEPLGPGNNGDTLKDFAICGTAAGRLNIYLPRDMDTWAYIAEQMPGVVGPNWIVLAPGAESVADIIQAALGGKRPPVTNPAG